MKNFDNIRESLAFSYKEVSMLNYRYDFKFTLTDIRRDLNIYNVETKNIVGYVNDLYINDIYKKIASYMNHIPFFKDCSSSYHPDAWRDEEGKGVRYAKYDIMEILVDLKFVNKRGTRRKYVVSGNSKTLNLLFDKMSDLLHDKAHLAKKTYRKWIKEESFKNEFLEDGLIFLIPLKSIRILGSKKGIYIHSLNEDYISTWNYKIMFRGCKTPYHGMTNKDYEELFKNNAVKSRYHIKKYSINFKEQI